MTRVKRPILWLLLPLFIAATVGSGWATIHYFPQGRSSQVSQECQSLRTFILANELHGKVLWDQYHSNVLKYQTGLASNTRQVELVKTIASQVVNVLETDLVIYQEMFAHRACLTADFNDQIEGTISDTQLTIDFLRGATQIQGQSFDPTKGVWNSNFYDVYESATNYLKK